MPNLTIEALVDRVEALEQRNRTVERSNRRWRLAGVSAIALAGLIAAGGAFQVAKVEAQISQYTGNKYELTDGDGKSRGVFQVSNNGSAGLGFLSSDPDGVPTALVVDKDGNPTLLLSDGGGKPKMVGTVEKDGTTTFSLVDGKLNPRIALTVSPNGEPKITIRNADNQVTWEAP